MRGVSRLSRCVLALLGALVLFTRPAAGQEAVNYASVSGQVADTSGGVIRGAEVAARQTDTNIVTQTATDEEGRFRFPYLRVGPYTITVSAKGFAAATRKLNLGVGAAFNLPIALAVDGVETTVTVAADETVLETARSQIAGTVSQAEAQALPLNGRNVLDLALLIPGVSATNVGGGTQLFPETSAVPGVGLSVGSQRNFSNNFLVDGLSANDDAAGLSGISFSVDAIDQFQAVTAGAHAELGRALGGQFNIATRSGTSSWRGDSYAFFRDDALNARNQLSGTKLPMHQNQFGLSIGGPLRRDRTFLFANVEQRQLDQYGLVTISPDNVAAINSALGAAGYPGPGVSTGIYPSPIDTTHVLGKIDHHVSGRDLFSIRYSLYRAASENSRGAGGIVAPTASTGLDNLDQALAVSNVWTLSPRVVLETRGQVAVSDLEAPPGDPIGPAVNISGVASFGTASGSPTSRRNTLVQVVNNLSRQTGNHALRAGVDLLYNDLTITYPRSIRGSYSFSGMPGFLAGTYNNSGFTQTFGDTGVAVTNPNVGIYMQDEWQAASTLTINTGLRYDLQYLETVDTDTDNVAPRLGVAWTPFASRRTVIRGNVGRFYDRVPLRALANALLSANNTTDLSNLRQISVTLSPGQTGAPAFPNILSAAVPSATLVNFTTMDRDIQNARSDQASVEVEQQLGARRTVSVGYEHLRGRNLIMQVNQNVPTCAVSGSNNGCRPIAAYANNNQYSSLGTSVYDGLSVSFIDRPADWWSARVSYTYSKSMNDVGEAFFNSPIDPFDLSKDWGRSDDDQRHRLVVSGTISTPATPARNWQDALTHGFQLSGVLQYSSALPFNITTGTNTIQGTAARPLVDGAFIARNAGEGCDFSTVSLRLSRTFAVGGRARLEALVEAFNLLDHRNDVARVTVFGTGSYPTQPAANFGQVTVGGEPRALQLGLRFRY